MILIRVLQINSVCGSGSTGRIVVDMYRELERKGHECVIAYGRGSAPENVKTIKIGNNYDKYIHGLKTRVFDKHGFGSKRATERFIEEVKKFNPDVVHLHNLHGYYLNIEVLFNYLKKENKKIIWTLHDCWAFTGHCSYFDYVGCSRWKRKCEKCIQKKEYPSSNIVDNSEWNFERKKELFTSIKKENMQIITPSIWLSSYVKQSFLKKYDTKVINNGIDIEIFKPRESDFRDKYNLNKRFIILGVANIWNRRKGLEYFSKLSEELDESYKIILVGINNEDAKKLPENILTIRRTNNVTELAEIYTAADVYVNPTLEDNYPTTNLESICCGTPVITFDSGGSSESLNFGEYGISVKDKNVKSLVDSINIIKSNKRPLDIDIQVFSKRDKCMEYMKIYKLIMGRGK